MSDILTPAQLAVLTSARERYGKEHQLVKSAEECAEFAAEVLRWIGGDSDGETKMISEAADVIICCQHIIAALDGPELRAAIEYKVNRLEKRLEGDL